MTINLNFLSIISQIIIQEFTENKYILYRDFITEPHQSGGQKINRYL
jgi:hypothetical protein